MGVLGNTILIYRGSTIIGGVKGNEVKSDVDLQEVSSASQGTWKEYKTMRKGWSITVNYLMLSNAVLGNGSGLRDVLEVGNSFTLHFKSRGASDSTGLSGTAILKTCDIKAVRGNLVTGTFQFVGSGALS